MARGEVFRQHGKLRGAVEQPEAGEGHRVDSRSRCVDARHAVYESSEVAEAEERRVEAEVFEYVVVHAVVGDAEAAAHHQFLLSGYVIRETDPGAKLLVSLFQISLFRTCSVPVPKAGSPDCRRVRTGSPGSKERCGSAFGSLDCS